MTTWRVTAGCLAVVLGAAGCSGGGDASATTTTSAATSTTTTSTAPARPASTTTTAYDPAAVEGQVEAAYLRSWDVYADAVYDLVLDEQALADVYADDALELRRNEVQRRIDEGRASLVIVDHRYDVVLTDPATAVVIDNFVNHQVVIDPQSKEPMEPDPNEVLLVSFRMILQDGSWRVAFIEKVSQ